MSQPADLHLMVEHPMPTRDHAALLASYRLLIEQADVCLPVQVRPTAPTSFFESWEITRAAFMARMSSTLRHLGYLAPSYSRLDGVALARTLVDHAITFAWISADPKERLPAFIRASFSSQLDKDKAARKRGVQLLDAQPRKLLQAYVRTVRQDLPGLPPGSRVLGLVHDARLLVGGRGLVREAAHRPQRLTQGAASRARDPAAPRTGSHAAWGT